MSSVGGTHLSYVRKSQLLTHQHGAMEQGSHEVSLDGGAGQPCPDGNVRLGVEEDSHTLWHSQVRGMAKEGFAGPAVLTHPKCQGSPSAEAGLSPQASQPFLAESCQQ